MTTRMRAPTGISSSSTILFRDGTAGAVDAAGLIQCPAAFVDDLLSAGFTVERFGPAQQYTAMGGSTGTLAAGAMEGAQEVFLKSSGGTTPTLTTRTAAQLIAALPGLAIGDTFMLRVLNYNSGTMTLAGGTSVTISGTATLPTITWTDFLVTIASATTVTMQNVGAGDAL